MFPVKGEVQERFNPRPYFDYLHVQPKRHQTSSGSSKPSPVYGTPFDSFPVFRGSDPSSSADAKPSEFSSGPSADSYSPMMNGNMNGNGGKESDTSMMFSMDSYQPTKDDDSKPVQNGNDYPGFPYAPPTNGGSEEQAMTPSKEAASESMSESDSEMAEKEPKENHDYSHYQDVGPMIVNTVRPPGPMEMHYHDHPPYYNRGNNGGMNGEMGNGNGNGADMSMDNGGGADNGGDMDSGGGGDMDMAKGYPQLPEYLDHPPKDHYPHFFYDHHPVYHEIATTTTTTTEAPQEERVNNNYSYYYLGRKLWYIPLYFSAYFIIYITVLILKSIARHKVSFWQDLHNLGSRREGRNLNLEEITNNVTSSIERAQAKYMM